MKHPARESHGERPTREESDRVRAVRGFPSFERWAEVNRKAAAAHRQNGKQDLAAHLDAEYERHIANNL